MKKNIIAAALIFSGIFTAYACTGSKAQSSAAATAFAGTPQETEATAPATPTGEVIQMDKAMFIANVFDYEHNEEWKYKGELPAIIDLYADWCGPCRMTAPIMKELAKEYAGKIVIYKVNVDKERELSSLFNATSIPLFAFIPLEGKPQLFRGAADKATYKKVIDEFLLKAE